MEKRKKYLKVMFGTTSGANNNVDYKLNEVNIAEKWNPTATDPCDMGGFNFSTEDKILRWLVRGDTLYDVTIPDDTEVINCPSESAPNGVFRCNKIIVYNPRNITDDIAMELYLKSDLPEKSYYKSLIGCAIRGYRNTCLKIIKDKVNKDNIYLVLNEAEDFVKPYQSSGAANNGSEVYEEIMGYLNEIKSNLLISRFVDKKPYIKKITDDNIINLTGQSGSGKSYYAKEHFDNEEYVIVDTDEVFSDKRFSETSGINKELGIMFREKYKELPTLAEQFDMIYEDILDYCKNIDKTIVIDCAVFHYIKDINKLKGTVIVIRTCIDTCYKRTISRWIENHKKQNLDYTEEELEKYKNRKKGIYSWYNGSNKFLENIDNL